jgi:hypothetical protein
MFKAFLLLRPAVKLSVPLCKWRVSVPILMNKEIEAVLLIKTEPPTFRRQMVEVSSRLRGADLLVFALILGFGVFQFFHVARSGDFVQEDVFYSDAAHSLMKTGLYGINGYPETNMPPGVAWTFAFLNVVFGGGHVLYLRSMVVFGCLGFLASYELLRRQLPRLVAAAICLLLISSGTQFKVVSEAVSACFPYFFTAMAALLVARKLDESKRLAARIGWGVLLTGFVVATLMFASVGIAFLGGIVASVAIIFLRDRRLGFTHLKNYAAVLILAVAVQAHWMQPRAEASAGIAANEWPVPGFPRSYVQQLKLKDGREPELGFVTLRDIPVRMLKNAYEHANLLSQLLLARHIYLAWMSIATIGMLLLIALGWCYTIWRSGGGLQEWYFAGYEFIYFLWPWDLEPRFFLPVAPLACLYAWRGGEALVSLVQSRPRALGIIWFPMSILLAVHSWFWMHGIGRAGHLPHAGYQDETSFVFWALSAIAAAWLAWVGPDCLKPITLLHRWYSERIDRFRIGSMRPLHVLALAILALLVGKGLSAQLATGRQNLDLNSAVNQLSTDAEAGAWIRSHSDANSVVMARHVPTVFHFSDRQVVWFPMSTDPHLLMDGILRNKVDFVLVVRRPYNYYLPPDDECFAPLVKAYPGSFHLLYENPQFSVFQVLRNSNIHLG